jgi:hypothetical protein
MRPQLRMIGRAPQATRLAPPRGSICPQCSAVRGLRVWQAGFGGLVGLSDDPAYRAMDFLLDALGEITVGSSARWSRLITDEEARCPRSDGGAMP